MSYSIEGHDGVISGEGIQVYRTAAEAAQHHANRTGESWYVIDDETGEREEFAPEENARRAREARAGLKMDWGLDDAVDRDSLEIKRYLEAL